MVRLLSQNTLSVDAFFIEYLELMSSKICSADARELEKCAEMLLLASRSGKKVIIYGNGGSAAVAGHVAVDLSKNAHVRSVNFNEANLITCLANDYGYDAWLSKAIEIYSDAEDLLILISSSGKSKNMLNAAEKAREKGLKVVTFTGFSADNPLRKLGDLNFWVNSSGYNIVEMTHSIWLLAIVDFLIGSIEYSAQRQLSISPEQLSDTAALASR